MTMIMKRPYLQEQINLKVLPGSIHKTTSYYMSNIGLLRSGRIFQHKTLENLHLTLDFTDVQLYGTFLQNYEFRD